MEIPHSAWLELWGYGHRSRHLSFKYSFRDEFLLRFDGHLRMSAAMRMEVFHGNKEKLSAVDLHLILTQGGCGQNLGLLGGSPCIHMRSAYGR